MENERLKNSNESGIDLENHENESNEKLLKDSIELENVIRNMF